MVTKTLDVITGKHNLLASWDLFFFFNCQHDKNGGISYCFIKIHWLLLKTQKTRLCSDRAGPAHGSPLCHSPPPFLSAFHLALISHLSYFPGPREFATGCHIQVCMRNIRNCVVGGLGDGKPWGTQEHLSCSLRP